MIRFSWKTRLPLAALLLLIGSGTVTAGIFDFWKSKPRESRRGIVARAQEPNPAPPAPLDPDPAYAVPAEPAAPAAPPAAPAVPWAAPHPTGDCAPSYSGFSGGGDCHAVNGCREPDSCCAHGHVCLSKSCRRFSGDSYYCDCFPLFGPRYGYYTTCWRRLPEDCRCPIYLPPRKPQAVSDPIPTDGTSPAEETIPPPPQVLNFR